MVSNSWTSINQTKLPQNLIYPWVKNIITFAAEKEMMGHILLGETNSQGLRVTLLYPEEMTDDYWLAVKPLLDNVEFDANLLPLKSTEERFSEEIGLGRSVYQELSLPSNSNLVGAEPQQIALDIFGLTEPIEGNFQEHVQLEEQSEKRAIITLTQTGLPDDSVEGTRYRLEFIRDSELWRLDWVGRQVRCYRDSARQAWTTASCP